MNAQHLRRVADAIEHQQVEGLGFNQSVRWDDEGCALDFTGRGCRTTACIAGWTCAVFGERAVIEARHVDATAIGILGLTPGEAASLFRAAPLVRPVTPEKAVRTLRYAADHGVIDWKAANADDR